MYLVNNFAKQLWEYQVRDTPPSPDLDCKDIPYKRFTVLPPDPHNFDREGDGLGCES
jgi:hypothetical protein